jgi:hypothetical protein
MGRFLSTIQLQNRKQINNEQFAKILSRHMKKNGFVPATEKDSQISYSFAFSGNSEWITLSSPAYQSELELRDVQSLAKTMKTIGIITNILDSDMATLSFFSTSGERKDTVVVGRPDYEYEEKIMGQPKYWKPLLDDSFSWEQLLEIWNKDEVFVENLLSEMAPVFGMDSFCVCTDYADWEHDSPKSGATTMHFKNNEPLFLTEGETRLQMQTYSCYLVENAKIGDIFCFFNTGGVSKGLMVLLIGECFKAGEVEMIEMSVERYKEPLNVHANNDREYFSAPCKKCELPDGHIGYAAVFNDYEFFNGINTSHPSMKGKKGDDICHYHFNGIRMKTKILSGDMHKVYGYVIPLAANKNQAYFNFLIAASQEAAGARL